MSDTEDLSRPTAAAVALQQSEARLRLMIDAVPAMITYLDTQQRFLFCNAPYLDMLGRVEDDVLGKDLAHILGTEMHGRLEAPLRVRHDRTLRAPACARKRCAGGPRGHVRAAHRRGPGGRVLLSHPRRECRQDAAAQARAAGRARPAHGLAQPTVVCGASSASPRTQPSPSAGVRTRLLDVDHFKQVNDTQGHGAGDQLLCAFALRLRATLRGCDVAARFGGDEFALILDGPISDDQTTAVARKLAEAMRMPFELAGATLHVTVSIGIGVARGASASAATLEAGADAALYRAKAGGRDRFELGD